MPSAIRPQRANPLFHQPARAGGRPEGPPPNQQDDAGREQDVNQAESDREQESADEPEDKCKDCANEIDHGVRFWYALTVSVRVPIIVMSGGIWEPVFEPTGPLMGPHSITDAMPPRGKADVHGEGAEHSTSGFNKPLGYHPMLGRRPAVVGAAPLVFS